MSDATWLPIQYRDFYDIPRAFVVEREGATYFFDCPFDAALDEYPDLYHVYRLPPSARRIVDAASWVGLENEGTFLADVPVKSVSFDPTRRAAIDEQVFDSVVT